MQLETLDATKNAMLAVPAPEPGVFVCQPSPTDGKDIWTTSKMSYASGGETPGGGRANDFLRVGGWGDSYLSLLQFNLSGMPTNADSAVLHLFCHQLSGGGTPLYVDRITQPWDWKTSGTGRDRERLWWADRPPASPWRQDPLPIPVAGQWYAIDITGIYNAWQSGAWTNYGIQLRPEPSSNDHFDDFFSSRYTNNPALRPKLIVTPRKRSSPSAP